MVDLLTPNAKVIAHQTGWLLENAVIHIEHMASEGKSSPKVLRLSAAEVENAVRKYNGPNLRRNLYWVLDGQFFEGGKRSKSNLTAAQYAHVDLDFKDYPGTPEEQHARVVGFLLDPNMRPEWIPPPTLVYMTGGGYQALWRLEKPASPAEVELINKAILIAMEGGPGTHDPGRLLRLPGTVNWLNDKKRKDGREPVCGSIAAPTTFDEPPVSYRLEDFDPPADVLKQINNRKVARKEPNTSSARGGPVASRGDALEIVPISLPEDLSEVLPSDPDWVEAIATGKNPLGKQYATRSELVFACVLWMLGRGIAPGHVLSIITERSLSISAHVLEKPNPLKYAQRQVLRGMEMLERRNSKWPVTDDYGRPIASHPDNVRHALALLEVDAQRNAFTQSDEYTGCGLEGRDLNDIGDILWSAFISELQFSAQATVIKRVLLAIAHERQYHPVIDYLDGLEWDGQCRIDRWLTHYCSADDTELNREFGSKLLIAGVRRIKNPGVKFDTMLVLEGAQGAGKSRLAAKLAVRDEWFCGSLDLRSEDKTKAELLNRAWIVECQELDGLNKATGESLKRFLSTAIDTYRRSYARDASEQPRHCIIIGTTNEDTYLRDLTGNRRIWPVRVGSIDVDRFSNDVDQLWAEAVVRERAGESITLSKHLWSVAAELQAGRMVDDAYADVLEGHFADLTGKVSMDSVKLLLGIDTDRMTPNDTRRIKAAMTGLGWEYGTHRLSDLARLETRPRKGFAAGVRQERTAEYVAERSANGAVRLVPIDASSTAGQEIPF